MLSIENPPPDPSCSCDEVSQLNSSSTDVLQSDLLISCPKFTIRDYAFSNRSKDIKTNWPFSEKSLQLCLNHGVKDLLPPFQSLDAEENPAAQRCTIATNLVSIQNEYHLIDQASRPSNNLLSFTSDDARPCMTSAHTSLKKSEGVRNFSSMVVEAQTSLNYSASKPVKKPSLVANKADNIMKPLTKKCREIVKPNSTASDQNKLENNTSNNFLVSETIASKVCPVCKMFTSSSNTTLNAHIDRCLSGESVSQWTSDPKLTKSSRIKPKRMRSMVEIYKTAQHCTIEELERRNGINMASCLSLPAQDMEVDVLERKRKPPFDFEETENEGDVYVDTNGTKLRILSKLNDMASPVKARDQKGTRRHVDDYKSSKLCFSKKKKKKLQEKHHKLQIHVSDRKKSCSPRHHQNSQIIGIQEHTSGPEEHLEVEEAFAKPQRAHVLIKNIESESEGQRKQSCPTKMNDKGGHLHPTWARKKKLAGVSNMESRRYSSMNGGCCSKSNKSSGTPPAFSRSSEPHDDFGRAFSLRKSVRVPLGSEPFHDRNNHLGEGNQKESKASDSSVKFKNKDGLRNKLNPMASLSIQKVKIKRSLTRNVSGVGDNSNHIPNGPDLSSKSRGFSSFTKKQASRLFKPESAASESTFGNKSKRMDLKRPRAYCESESDEEEVERQTVARTSDNLTLGRRTFKIRMDREKIKVSGKGEILVIEGTKSTSKHCDHQIDGTNDSYSDNVTAGSDDENEAAQDDVQTCDKDVFDEATCSNPFIEASKLCKSSDTQRHEMAGHLDGQSNSRGYMKFCDGPSLGTEDAIYPVESYFNGGEKMFYMNEDVKIVLGQNVLTATELHSNDGSSSYCAEFDLIPIPGPPGSFLPSPSSNEFHGNSTPMSSQDQSSENHHEFPDGDSSDSPSPTSTISNSDIAKFGSSLNEKLPFRHNIQDGMRSSVSDATCGTMVDKIPLDPSAAFAAGEDPDLVEPKVHLLYSDPEEPLRFKNDPPCRCSRKDGAVLNSDVLNYQDASLLSWPSIPSVPESQVNSDTARRAKNYNLLLNVSSTDHLAEETHNATGDPPRLIANKASTNSGIKFFYTDGESASPSTPNSIVRLMGKDLMVVNKDEASYSHQTTKEIVVIDDASESSVNLATDPLHGMGLINHRRPSIKPALVPSGVSPGNYNSMNGYQQKTSHSGSLPLARTATLQVPPMMGVKSSLPIKWNCVSQGSNLIPSGSPSAGHHMRFTTPQSGSFS